MISNTSLGILVDLLRHVAFITTNSEKYDIIVESVGECHQLGNIQLTVATVLEPSQNVLSFYKGSEKMTI